MGKGIKQASNEALKRALKIDPSLENLKQIHENNKPSNKILSNKEV